MMEWEGLREFVESHSLELMKKADELPLIRSNIVSMHDLLSCHLHTLTLVLTYKNTLHALTHTLIFTHPHSHACSSHSSHPHYPCTHSLITPSLPLIHSLISHPHYPHTHSLISHPHYPCTHSLISHLITV